LRHTLVGKAAEAPSLPARLAIADVVANPGVWGVAARTTLNIVRERKTFHLRSMSLQFAEKRGWLKRLAAPIRRTSKYSVD